jgi:Uncharacterized conserved protein
MSQKLIINFSPTGMIPTKKLTPYVPISVPEIVENVHQAWELGIAMVHLHARDPITGEPTYKADVYGEMIGGIRKYAPEIIVCVSLSGRNFKEFEKRTEPLDLDGDLKPDMGSLTLSSLNFIKQASLNEPKMVQDIALKLKERGMIPELEAFDSGMINYAHYLIKKGLIEPPYYFNLLLGNIASAQADLLHVGIMIRELPDHSFWSFAGIGESQLMMNSVAIAIGAGVRVGLEDNIYFDHRKTKLANNMDFLRRIHSIAEANERPIMTAKELRKLLNLQEGTGHYGRQ